MSVIPGAALLLRNLVVLCRRMEIKQIMLAFVFLKAFLAPESSWEGQMLSVRENVCNQWFTMTVCSSQL